MLAASPMRPIPPTFTPINADIDDRRQENKTKVHSFCWKMAAKFLFCQSQAKIPKCQKEKEKNHRKTL